MSKISCQHLIKTSLKPDEKVLSQTEVEVDLKFILLGDWGKGGINGDITTITASTYNMNDDDENKLKISGDNNKNNDNNKVSYTYQVAIAKAMGSWANFNKPSFVVSLGDNFYTNGVASTTDTMWKTHWQNVYIDNYDSLRIPWYAVFGNHDYGYGESGLTAQLEFSSTPLDSFPETKNFWKMNAKNYSERFYLPGGQGYIGIVFIDSTTLAPSQNKCCNQNGGVSVEIQTSRIQNQLNHIERDLKSLSDATWLLVVGHYPVFSAGTHSDMTEMQTYLLPLLKQYKVNAYISGHDHISEHLSYEGIEFFVAGGGSMVDSLGSVQSAAVLNWFGVQYSAFAVVTANEQNMTFEYFDMSLSSRYRFSLQNSFWKQSANNSQNSTTFPTYSPILVPITETSSAFNILISNIAVGASVLGIILLSFTGIKFIKSKDGQMVLSLENKSRSHYSRSIEDGDDDDYSRNDEFDSNWLKGWNSSHGAHRKEYILQSVKEKIDSPKLYDKISINSQRTVSSNGLCDGEENDFQARELRSSQRLKKFSEISDAGMFKSDYQSSKSNSEKIYDHQKKMMMTSITASKLVSTKW